MSQTKAMADALIGLFERAPVPIYVIDEERRIVFCNQGLASWTGTTAADLVGRRVEYHSQTDPASAPGVAAGLCPPPAALSGTETTGHVSCMSRDGRLMHRRARFVPLAGDPAEGLTRCSGVVTFVASVDVEAESAWASDDDASGQREPSVDALHLRIQQFRARQARRYDLDRLVGCSPMARRAREQVAVAAANRVCVLVIGPIGSGRAHVARAIHYRSDPTRRAKLALLSCHLQGTDLLRHTFESLAARAADGPTGTLVLTDADAMSAELQTQLAALRGTGQPAVRVIATAQERLDALAEQGRFHRDLACALSTITIQLVPLSNRIDDLPILAQLFLEEANRGAAHQVGGFSSEALDLMAGHAWPGEIDELAAVVRLAHAAAEGHEVVPRDLPAQIHRAADLTRYPPRQEERIVLDQFLRKIENELIGRALKRARGNKAQAARLLGMTRPRLYRRLVQLGLTGVAPRSDDRAAT